MPQKSNKRLEAQKLKKETYDEIMKTFDKNGDALVDHVEARSLIKSLLKDDPTDAEVDFVMKLGGDHSTITRQELPLALARMRGIRDQRENLHRIFAEFDVDENGALEVGQLKNLLTSISDGNPPTDEEVNQILAVSDADNSGAISYNELDTAITIWYLDPNEETSEESRAGECEVKPQKVRTRACVIC